MLFCLSKLKILFFIPLLIAKKIYFMINFVEIKHNTRKNNLLLKKYLKLF